MQIPKPGGGTRQLGVPTVVDRLVQQAILQVLEPLLDPNFSPSSFGFRPGRSAHDALQQARGCVADGGVVVLDVDLEKFFDRVNHDIVMARLARRVADRRLLRIVRRFLEAGLMQEGVCIARREGTPQGGPLSPLLSNLLLDDLDRELERRGHRFRRYADDCTIYVRSKAAGERVFASVVRFLERVLRLHVNPEKSAVAFVEDRRFLGCRLLTGGRLGIATASLERAKAKVREITRRNRGVNVQRMASELNSFLTGWVTYFRLAACKSRLTELDGWIRRELRCVRLKQCKRTKTLADFFRNRGVSKKTSWVTALSGKGWLRLAGSPAAQQAMDQRWFDGLRLVKLVAICLAAKLRGTAGYDQYVRWFVRTGEASPPSTRLGIDVIWNPARQLQKNGVIERSQGTGKRWSEPRRCVSAAELQQRIDEADRIQRDGHPSVDGRSRAAAPTGLRRPDLVEWRLRPWSLARVLDHPAEYVLARRVDKVGRVGVYGRCLYDGGRTAADLQVFVTLDSDAHMWIVTVADGLMLRCYPTEELSQARICMLSISQRRAHADGGGRWRERGPAPLPRETGDSKGTRTLSAGSATRTAAAKRLAAPSGKTSWPVTAAA